MKLRIMAENNQGKLYLTGHVLAVSAIKFQAQPLVGRPWEWFTDFKSAAKYTRGE